MTWAFGFIAHNGFVRARRFYHSRICLKTAAKVSLTRTNSADGSTPNFRATQDFSMVANFSTRTVEGSFSPAPFQSKRIKSVTTQARWLVIGTTSKSSSPKSCTTKTGRRFAPCPSENTAMQAALRLDCARASVLVVDGVFGRVLNGQLLRGKARPVALLRVLRLTRQQRIHIMPCFLLKFVGKFACFLQNQRS